MKTIEEKNRMIAEFMGFKPENTVVNVAQPSGYTNAKNVIAYQIEAKRTDGITNLTHDYMLKYHKSWDWLMPVVAKITRDEEFIDDDFRESVLDVVGFGRIDDTYRVVVEFIEMYNKQN